jgi:glutathione gamma-glutamylcysteinyltransferase
MTETLYRRPLPPETIAFSSAEGRMLFAEALAGGGLDGYFPLAEQFHTQSDPAFCGLGSLVVALNALGIDPGRLWKGPWRWFAEELLDCCVPLAEVKRRGLSLHELGCLARCNGAAVEMTHADSASVHAFRTALADAASGVAVLIASYDRGSLGQTGTGHFSPIGGYHARRDLALVLDVARFKYPPHWVSVERLFDAMQPVDEATGRARGWLTLRRRERGIALGYSIQCDGESWQLLEQRMAVTKAEIEAATDVASLVQALAPLECHVELRSPRAPAHREALDAARAALQSLPVHAQISRAVAPERAENVTLLLLAVSDLLTPEQRTELGALSTGHPGDPLLASEVANVREQLAALWAHAREATSSLTPAE